MLHVWICWSFFPDCLTEGQEFVLVWLVLFWNNLKVLRCDDFVGNFLLAYFDQPEYFARGGSLIAELGKRRCCGGGEC